MIRYDLRCSRDHGFDAWFRDSAGFEAQRSDGAVVCPVCGDTAVTKALMAPALGKAATPTPSPKPATQAPATTVSAAAGSPLAKALTALRHHLETEATYVGRRFPDEARRQHVESTEPRSIWGEATLEEAEALLDEGIAIAPLPPLPKRDD